MSEGPVAIEETTVLARWLLEQGVDGLGLTKTHALQRAIVREVAERWPHWWHHELFGPPHREADLPVLVQTHAGCGDASPAPSARDAAHDAQGRELVADPEALLAACTRT